MNTAIIPPFKTPIKRETIEGVFELYTDGSPQWLIAEAMNISRYKVAVILSPENVDKFPAEWRNPPTI